MSKYDKVICPHCGEKTLLPLVYGQPRWDIFREQEKGKCCFGGCMLKQNSKRWVCTSCGRRGDNEELAGINQQNRSLTFRG